MKKTYIILVSFFILFSSIYLTTAALCKDSSGYYNDCGNSNTQRTPMFMGNDNPYLVDRAYSSHYPEPITYSTPYYSRNYYSTPTYYSSPYYGGYGGYYGGPVFYGGYGDYYGGYYGGYGGYYSSYYWW